MSGKSPKPHFLLIHWKCHPDSNIKTHICTQERKDYTFSVFPVFSHIFHCMWWKTILRLHHMGTFLAKLVYIHAEYQTQIEWFMNGSVCISTACFIMTHFQWNETEDIAPSSKSGRRFHCEWMWSLLQCPCLSTERAPINQTNHRHEKGLFCKFYWDQTCTASKCICAHQLYHRLQAVVALTLPLKKKKRKESTETSQLVWWQIHSKCIQTEDCLAKTCDNIKIGFSITESLKINCFTFHWP